MTALRRHRRPIFFLTALLVGHARWRYYDSSAAWAQNSLRRLADWGFTTLGGWSDYESLLPAMTVKAIGNNDTLVGITPVSHLEATAGAPWWQSDAILAGDPGTPGSLWISTQDSALKGELLAICDPAGSTIYGTSLDRA